MTLENVLTQDVEFRYALLDRMRHDCQYYLSYGNRNVNTLWASTEQDQIDAMKAIWNSFPDDRKPEWLTWDGILSFEKRMIHSTAKASITKAELRQKLSEGATMEELFIFSSGQECSIFKAAFVPGDKIIYIPDLSLNHIPVDVPVPAEEIDDIVNCCYTGDDFLAECDGNKDLAEHLFWYCDWQHPSSAFPEVDDDEDPACV